MKFTVNGLCTGHARCFELADDVYELDDNGYNVDINRTVDVAPGQEASAVLGAHSCPERAIEIEE
ncbi:MULTISPECIES: ferredoxin [Rhodococcus]|uniref:Ferredoxin n=1 Tax=Rhodococcus jostii TaxID=132919 RepID=A0A1H4JKZ9_RHOJO|nr:ferredoxin [Rhodococcus jostii]SEB46827.1 ferredoxin [Rhodococcus jostii]